MSSHRAPGIVSGRLPDDTLARNFSDYPPPLNPHEASVAADRCYFCYDAPCITACPTEIDIPMFIRQIATGTPDAAAMTIWDQNILGGMCARVCPVEQLCEGACVREESEGKPVEIGRLQRYATDHAMERGQPYTRRAPTGKRIAVVGAGPAGLAAAHRLARHGNDVVIIDARPKAGGLNEYGIATYKTTQDFARREVEWLLEIGGITIQSDTALGRDITLEELRRDYDAVFLGMGLAGVNALRASGEAHEGVMDAVDFIAALRQARTRSEVAIGRDVVVIGGGMTAIDAAVQARLLGAENVTMVYRRSQAQMGASQHEQDHATSVGVKIVTNAMPRAIHDTGSALEVEFEYTSDGPDGLQGTGEVFRIPADQVFKAIGQSIEGVPDGLRLEGGKIVVDKNRRTSIAGVWAGGDCAVGGEDLTVTAVAHGRDAAEDIHRSLSANAG